MATKGLEDVFMASTSPENLVDNIANPFGFFGSSSSSTPVYSNGVEYSLPQFSSILTEDNTSFNAPHLQVMNYSKPQYIDELSTYANSTSASPWLQSQQDYLANYGANIPGDQGAYQSAMESLARTTGLTQGARDRLQEASDRSQMMATQRQGRALSDLGIDLQATEEAQKLGVLSMLPTLQANQANYDSLIQEQNIANLLEERNRERKMELEAYDTRMALWAANQQAGATQNIANQDESFNWFNPSSWF